MSAELFPPGTRLPPGTVVKATAAIKRLTAALGKYVREWQPIDRELNEALRAEAKFDWPDFAYFRRRPYDHERDDR